METLTIVSSDRKFLVKLIDWLAKQEVEKNSTTIRVGDLNAEAISIYNPELVKRIVG